MKEQFAFANQTSRRHGCWFRQGNNIFLYLDNPSWSDEQEVGGDPDDGLMAIQNAIRSGVRDENLLADTVFTSRHPERRGRRLQSPEQNLIKEWLDIRDRLVRLALRALPSARARVGPAPAQTAAQPPSTTSGVEAAGDVTQLIPCILGLRDRSRAISFAQRYLRDLTRAEISTLKKAGLRIESCYEENGSDPQVTCFTRARGQYDGCRAFAQAQAVGQPAGTPYLFRHRYRSRHPAAPDHPRLSLGSQRRLPAVSRGHARAKQTSCQILDWRLWQRLRPRLVPDAGNRHVVLAGIRPRLVQQPQRMARREHPHLRTRTPERCNWRLGRLEGWGNEGGW